MVVKQFGAMFKARTMEFVRDRGSLIFNMLMPILLVFGFAFAMGGQGDRLFKVGVMVPDGAAPEVDSAVFASAESIATAAKAPGSRLPALLADEQVSVVRYDPAVISREAALKKLSQHQIEMVLDPAAGQYWINPESPKSRLLKRFFEGEAAKTALAQPAAATQPAPAKGGAQAPATTAIASFAAGSVTGKAVRYVDWLVPGAIGMNMMFSCLFGVGFVIVRYRKNGVLKRLKATPVSALNFVLAQGASRFVIVLGTAFVVYAGTNLFLNFTMNGSYLLLILVTALSILSMISLGLVFAARFKSEELANGLMNLLTFPMLILSGVFFSLEGAPDFVRMIALVFPLTHFTDSARLIMIDGAGLAALAPHLLYLGGVSALFLLVSAWLFKWE
jgi:ABC-type multidrug transport system permease subunit